MRGSTGVSLAKVNSVVFRGSEEKARAMQRRKKRSAVVPRCIQPSPAAGSRLVQPFLWEKVGRRYP